jgi:hypothetical protein
MAKKFPLPKVVLEDEPWITKYWRPMMAWQYFAVCVCDFIIFPLIAFHYAKETGNEFKWDPMTLKDSGFYHMAMGVVIGVSAWTRGQENILRTRLFAQAETQDTISPSIQGVDDEINEGLDPPKHPSKRRGG